MSPSDTMAGSAAPAASPLAARVAQAVVVAIAAASLLVLSLAFDARLTIAAANLPADAVAWGSFVSNIGKSGYMFAIAAALALGALAARTVLRVRTYDIALTLLAERASFVFATLAVSGLAAQLIKHLVGRARPQLFSSFGAYHFDVLSMKNALASFPSGHTTTAFAMAVALSLLIPQLRVPLFTLAVAIGLSRIVVHAHFASDVAAGAVLGAGSARLLAGVFADRSIAFTRTGGRVVLKGPGAIVAALSGAASHHP